MNETICQFGPGHDLFGILVEPNPVRPRPNLPVVLFLNAGALHHVGPFGWVTTLSRRLGERGIPSLRFDLSGIGESPARSDGRGNLDQAMDDVRAAMDYLAETRSSTRFVLFGLCMGAVLAHYASARDPRIVGTISIDTFSYPTKSFYLRQVGEKALRWQSWKTATKLLAQKVSGAMTNAAEDDSDTESHRMLVDAYFLPKPPQDEARQNLATALNRGTRMLYFYTESVRKYFNHPRQFQEMYGDLPRADELVEIEMVRSADHLYTMRHERLAMFDRVDRWYEQHFGTNDRRTHHGNHINQSPSSRTTVP